MSNGHLLLSLQLLDSILLFDNFTLEATQSCIQTRLTYKMDLTPPINKSGPEDDFVCTFHSME